MSVDRVLIEKNVAVPMRDGVLTYGDLYRPAEGPAMPALVSRTPYDKEGTMPSPLVPQPQKLAERGYAVLIVDTRGRFSSEGRFEPFHDDAEDGYDTVEWAASQPWCDGNVGIYGPSYVGATTLLAARERPPSLRCAIPIITADDYYDGWDLPWRRARAGLHGHLGDRTRRTAAGARRRGDCARGRQAAHSGDQRGTQGALYPAAHSSAGKGR